MTAVETRELFSLNLMNTNLDQAVETLLDGSRPKTAAFVNAHCINETTRSADYRWALERADHILPDGSGIALAAKLRGFRMAANLNGTDLFVPLCRKAAEKGLSVFLLGSRDGVAAAAADKACELAPGLRIAGTRHGYFNDDETGEVIAEINRSGADIVLVALGVPRQDVWIARNRQRIAAHLVMGVGAQFDFWSGRVPRAPALLRHTGLEWTFRLAVEPRRMARRYLIGNPVFVWRAAKDAFKKRAKREKRETGMTADRLLDLAVTSSALIALAPLFAGLTVAVRITSPGPAFFKQVRVGKDGKPFHLYKFRSMYIDAEERRQAVLKLSDRKGVCFKARNDPRITPIGRFLRRYSLDELPQLFNVLTGDMSIVGPRPSIPSEVEAFPPRALGRLSCKPGLTGVWQVAGRAEIGFEKMIDMDLAYARSKSVVLDIMIMMLTARAVLTGRGAY
ncbi:WecB/TagA/CpsF family glycosyltransferase [Oricola sp.]|uniref:WecB/TagA/CpsF family glycosyltransferase n=1 Tax=Oricola sp. TaxID=1979950 RepID=UPI003BAC7D77